MQSLSGKNDSPAWQPDLRSGLLIGGRYELLDQIGEGATSTVYKVRDSANQRIVALKVLKESAARHPRFAECFHRELNIGRQLDHPNVVRIYEAGQHENWLYLVMEYVNGRTLTDLLRMNPRFGLPDFELLYRQLLAALQCVHSLGLVHRDIKPGNLHRGDDGQWRILDLGVALSGRETAAQRELHAGTPSYMNPEQWPGGVADAGSDLFALGVTLYQWLTGRLPYGEIEPYQTARYRRDPTPPSRQRPDVPIWLDHLLLKAVAREPALRFETAEELLLALQRGAARPVSAPGATPLLRRDPRAAWQLALAFSVLLNALLLVWLLFLPR